MLFLYHFLAIKSQCSQFGHSFISEFYPTFFKTNSFISSLFGSIFSKPLTFLKKEDSLNSIRLQKFSDIIGFHIRWNSRNIANSFVGLFEFILLNLLFRLRLFFRFLSNLLRLRWYIFGLFRVWYLHSW